MHLIINIHQYELNIKIPFIFKFFKNVFVIIKFIVLVHYHKLKKIVVSNPYYPF